MAQEDENKEALGNDAGNRLAELEALLASREAEIAKTGARVAELERELAETQQRLGAAGEGLKQAVSSYRALTVKANPVVPQDLITGETIADIDLSVKSARELIGKVKKNIEAELTAARVPAGAPPRSSQAASALSPREKIQQGMEKEKR